VTAAQQTYFGSEFRRKLFTAVKYLVFLLLFVNIFLFLQEELGALEHTFVDGFEPSQVIQVFSATIDTTAWLILLLLFELETSVLDDHRIHGWVKWTLHGVRGLCYVAVFYAFTGYLAELGMLYDTFELSGFSACDSLDSGYAVLTDIDEYEPLTRDNCGAMIGTVSRFQGFDIVADAQHLQAARWLGWTDVVNSASWLLVVIVLEAEVRLQLRGNLSLQVMNSTKMVKFAVYGALFLCAGYWGVAGDFLDFWDAFLWLFAFIFIELNVFEWQYETSVADAKTS
jgi:hypothetical protein